jgi:PKD repeat protein
MVLHTSVPRILLLCAITAVAHAGDFPNVTQVPGTLLNGPIHPQQGRTAIVAWHGGRVVSVPEAPGSQNGADLRVRIVNISDPANPQVTVMPYAAGGLSAHGYLQYGRYLWISGHEVTPGSGVYRDSLYTTATGVFQERSLEQDGGLPLSTYTKSGAQSPWGAREFWSYNNVGGNAFLTVRRSLAEYTHDWNNGGSPTGPAVKASFDLLGQTGIIGFPFIMGNILIYASDMSGTGAAAYDISDPANPVLLDVLKGANIGGYWPEVYGHYIFFPRRDGEGGPNSQAGFTVVDFQDPTNLRLVASRNLTGSNQYVTFQDEYAFMNNYKIDMRTFDTVLTLATNYTTLDASQFALPVGNLVVTGGYGSFGPGLAIWAHQAAPDMRGPFVAYHVPAADQTNYSRLCPITLSIPETLRSETIVDGSTLIVRPVGGAPVPCWHALGQGKLLTVTPIAPLAANTTYEVLLTSGIEDAAGNGMEPYSFRFSTGSGLAGGNRPPAATALSANPAPAIPNAIITFVATASDPDGDPIEYRFDFGDGSPRTAWGTTNSATHAYTSARHYQVTVQVRDAAAALSSFSRGITVAAPLVGPRPLNTSPIVLGSAARRIWNVNPDANTLTAINADSLAKIWEQPTGSDPRSVALANDGTLWVACHDADRIDVLDAASGAIITSISTGYGSAPIGICASPDGLTMYATCSGDGTFRRFSVVDRAQSGSLSLGASPRAIAITSTGARALVTRFISGEHEGSVYDVNLAGSMALTRTIRLPRIFAQDGPAGGRGVPNYLAGIAITPDNSRAWVVGKKDNTLRGTFTSANLPLGQDSTVRAQVMVIDLTTNAETQFLRMDIDNSESPTAIAFSPLGDYAFIALQGNNQIGVVDYLEFMRADSAKGLMTRLGTGLAPQGLVQDPASGRLFVHDFMGRTVTALELNPLFVAGNLNVPSSAVASVAAETLPDPVLRGKRIFYNSGDRRMSAEGYISCATCHADGGHDGRTFDFTQRGEGFRNTTDLRGKSGTGHGAVHWTANFNEIQDFENDIRNAFGGTGFMSDADFAATNDPLGAPKAGRSGSLDDLSAYVTSLGASSIPRSPRRQPDGQKTLSAQRGEAVFNRENCASCHMPSTGFTDRQRHNVGTLRATSGQRRGGLLDGIDTPTLLGVHASAPYFHDGSARTLAEVFTIAGGDMRQAETGVLANGAAAGDNVNQAMKSWHGSAMVVLDAPNEEVTFNNIDGGSGGAGMIEIRYCCNYSNVNLEVLVNGVALTSIIFPMTPNDPNYMTNEWRIFRVFNVPFAAGMNSVTLRRNSAGGPVLSLDDVVFSTPVIDALAAAHRRNLSAGDLTDLTAYIDELDGSDLPAAPSISSLFANPNPAAPGVNVQFGANATGSNVLVYAWTFGDGIGAAEATAQHAYPVVGVYNATLTVTDLHGQAAVGSLNVFVNADGGTAPEIPGGGGPGGGAPNGDGGIPPGALPLTVSKLQGRFKTGSTRDQCQIAGIIPALPPSFNPQGLTTRLSVGGAAFDFVFDGKGRAKNANGSVTLKLKATGKNPLTRRPIFGGGDAAFMATLKGGMSAAWLESQSVLSGDVVRQSVGIDVIMELNGNTYATTVPATYSGKEGKGGAFKK